MAFDLAGITIPSRQEFKDETRFEGLLQRVFRPRGATLRAIDDNLELLERQARALPGSRGEESRELARGIADRVDTLRGHLADWLGVAHRRNAQPARELLDRLDEWRFAQEQSQTTAVESGQQGPQQGPSKRQLASQSPAEAPRSPPPVYAAQVAQGSRHQEGDRPPSYAAEAPPRAAYRRGVVPAFPTSRNPSAQPQLAPVERESSSVQSQTSPRQSEMSRPFSTSADLLRNAEQLEQETQRLARQHGRNLPRDSTLEQLRGEPRVQSFASIYDLYGTERRSVNEPTASTSYAAQSSHSPPSGQSVGPSSGDIGSNGDRPDQRGARKGGRSTR